MKLEEMIDELIENLRLSKSESEYARNFMQSAYHLGKYEALFEILSQKEEEMN